MSTPLGPGYANPPGIQLDPLPLDPAWPVPRRPGVGGGVIVLIVGAILILLIGTIWAAGGFERRQDRIRAYAPGATVDVGSFTFTMERAEVRLQPEGDYKHDGPHWEIRAYGTATNTAGEPILLFQSGVVGLTDGWVYHGRDMAAMTRTPDGTLVTTKSMKLEPGIPNLPIRVSADLPGEWEPTGHVFVGVREQCYAAHQIDQGFTNKFWRDAPHGESRGFWVPVTVLPPGAWT